MKKHISNLLTCARMVCSILLLLFSAYSIGFFVLYFLCGLTDILDGKVARKTNTVSLLGERLDTIADFMFIFSALYKLFPTVVVPIWLIVWFFVIGFIKLGSVVLGFVLTKQFVVKHTVMNKITGVCMFVSVFTLPYVELKYSGFAVCVIATIAAIHEAYRIVADIKS